MGYTLLRLMTERVKVPRALWVEAPFGRTFGEPGDRNRQRTLLLEAIEVLEEAREPGSILRSAVPPLRL